MNGHTTRDEQEAAYRAQHADFLAKIATLCTGSGSDFWDRLAADLLVAFTGPSERQIALVNAEVAKRQQNAVWRSTHGAAAPFQEHTMNDDDYIHAAHQMKRGGSFAAAIAEAYFCADKDNRGRLRNAFPDLFRRFFALHNKMAQNPTN